MYNGSWGHAGKTVYLRQQFLSMRLLFLGIQESRTPETFSAAETVLRIGSGHAHGGLYGVELWANLNVPYGRLGHRELYFKRADFQVLHRDPRALLVRVDTDFVHFALLVGYAPQSGLSVDVRSDWWETLQTIASLKAPDEQLFVLIDANADPGPCDFRHVLTHGFKQTANTDFLRAFLRAQDLCLPVTSAFHQGGVDTWVSPTGLHTNCIDHVCIPCGSLTNCTYSSVLTDFDLGNGCFDGRSGLFHEPLHLQRHNPKPFAVPRWRVSMCIKCCKTMSRLIGNMMSSTKLRTSTGTWPMALRRVAQDPREDLRRPSSLILSGIWGFASWKGARSSKNWNLAEDLNSCVCAFLPLRMFPLRTPVMPSGDMTLGYYSARFGFSVICTKPLGNWEWNSKRPRQLNCKRFFNHYHLTLLPRRFCMNWNKWLVPQTFARCTRKLCPSYEMIKGRFVVVQKKLWTPGSPFSCWWRGGNVWLQISKEVNGSTIWRHFVLLPWIWPWRTFLVCASLNVRIDVSSLGRRLDQMALMLSFVTWVPLTLRRRRIRSCWRPSHMVRKVFSTRVEGCTPFGRGRERKTAVPRIAAFWFRRTSARPFIAVFEFIPPIFLSDTFKNNSWAANAGFLLQQASIKPVHSWDLVANVDSMWEWFFLICAKHSTALCGN